MAPNAIEAFYGRLCDKLHAPIIEFRVGLGLLVTYTRSCQISFKVWIVQTLMHLGPPQVLPVCDANLHLIWSISFRFACRRVGLYTVHYIPYSLPSFNNLQPNSCYTPIGLSRTVPFWRYSEILVENRQFTYPAYILHCKDFFCAKTNSPMATARSHGTDSVFSFVSIAYRSVGLTDRQQSTDRLTDRYRTQTKAGGRTRPIAFPDNAVGN